MFAPTGNSSHFIIIICCLSAVCFLWASQTVGDWQSSFAGLHFIKWNALQCSMLSLAAAVSSWAHCHFYSIKEPSLMPIENNFCTTVHCQAKGKNTWPLTLVCWKLNLKSTTSLAKTNCCCSANESATCGQRFQWGKFQHWLKKNVISFPFLICSKSKATETLAVVEKAKVSTASDGNHWASWLIWLQWVCMMGMQSWSD